MEHTEAARKKIVSRAQLFREMIGHAGWIRYERFLRQEYKNALAKFGMVNDTMELVRAGAEIQLLERIANHVKFEIQRADTLERALPTSIGNASVDAEDEY